MERERERETPGTEGDCRGVHRAGGRATGGDKMQEAGNNKAKANERERGSGRGREREREGA